MDKQISSDTDTQKIYPPSNNPSLKVILHPSGLSDFLGCLHLDKDPLEIQKEMRNEWN